MDNIVTGTSFWLYNIDLIGPRAVDTIYTYVLCACYISTLSTYLQSFSRKFHANAFLYLIFIYFICRCESLCLNSVCDSDRNL